MALNITINFLLLLLLWLILRRPGLRLSMGLPLAYLVGLDLIHVPGALVHALPWFDFLTTDVVKTGFNMATIGSTCFVLGVWLIRRRQARKNVSKINYAIDNSLPCNLQKRFFYFCLYGGWLFTFLLTPIVNIPTVGAFVYLASDIWILGIALALPMALESRNLRRVATWIGATFVFPVYSMVLGGFLSYGSAAVISATASSFVSARKFWRALVTGLLVSFLGISFFLTYFNVRPEFRDVVWDSRSTPQQRLEATEYIFSNFSWLDLRDQAQLIALDERLNQNYFAGLSAQRLQEGSVEYLSGRSLWEGVLALVPRILWPEKPVFAGSGRIVANMTGLNLSTNASFGVGNVMEAYINFGMVGIIIGFTLFGCLLGWLDLRAATANLQGNTAVLLQSFLPAVAIIQPNGSMVELVGRGVMSWVAAIFWSKAWKWWSGRRASTPNEIDAPVVYYPNNHR